VRGGERCSFVDNHHRHHVLKTDVGDLTVVDDGSGAGREANDDALDLVGFERTTAQ